MLPFFPSKKQTVIPILSPQKEAQVIVLRGSGSPAWASPGWPGAGPQRPPPHGQPPSLSPLFPRSLTVFLIQKMNTYKTVKANRQIEQHRAIQKCSGKKKRFHWLYTCRPCGSQTWDFMEKQKKEKRKVRYGSPMIYFQTNTGNKKNKKIKNLDSSSKTLL